MSTRNGKARRTFARVRVCDLGASVEERERGGQPVVLYDQNGQRAVSVSPAARRQRVSPGMSRWEAERLCPEALAVEPNREKYAYFQQRVVEICGDYSPCLQAHEDDSISLDLTGTELLLGPPKEIAQEIRNRLRAEVGVSAAIGIGPNRMVARLACESAQPGAVVEVTREETQEFLGRLPILALPGVEEDQARRLGDMGLKLAKDLSALPVEAVERALGEWGRRLWELAQGNEPGEAAQGCLEYPGTRAGPTGLVVAQAEVRPATAERARVRAALRSAADEAGRRLRQQGQVARQIGIAVVFNDMRVGGARRTLAQATRSGEVIFRAAGALFDRMKLGGRMVRRVRITAGRVSPGPHGGQLGLPMLEPEQRRERLAERINQVKDRFGEGAVARGSALGLAAHTSFYPPY